MTRPDVPHQNCACAGTVASPEFRAHNVGACPEEEQAPDSGEQPIALIGMPRESSQHHRANCGSVALPQLPESVTRHNAEEQLTCCSDEIHRMRTSTARIDVIHQDRPRCCSIRFPETGAVLSIVRTKEKNSAHDGQETWVGARGTWSYVLQDDGPDTRSVALPEFRTVNTVIRDEVEHPAPAHGRVCPDRSSGHLRTDVCCTRRRDPADRGKQGTDRDERRQDRARSVGGAHAIPPQRNS